MRVAVRTVFILLALAAPAGAQRLTEGASPEHYDLWFAPDLKTDTFRGRTAIDVELRAPSTSITLHAAEMQFENATITAAGRTQTARVTPNVEAETATLTVNDPLPRGPVVIEIAYHGVLNDKLRGFYISHADNRKYAVTQMEPTDARRAFPSFDEPAFKATFAISLLIDEGDTAISNGSLVSDLPGPEAGKHTLTFATTAKMSTYLVAMVVGNFVCREGKSDGTPIRVCSTPDKRDQTAFALEAAEQQLEFYNDYFGVTYPFGKLDIVAVPDFAAGAMENAGAITFRERLLLVDPSLASSDSRKRVAGVLAHEIAHMWFGDLVTMKWWDDIWLNEGFATWMAGKPLAAWRPDWRVELDDAEGTQDALATDALRSTRAIRTRADTPQQISELFDSIAYDKTAAVLRMIESYVGADAFRQAIGSYVRKYAYGNATGEDFWNEIASVTGRPIDVIMQTFVDQPGAPVLSATDQCGGTRRELSVRQERFVGSPGSNPPRQGWTFPACVRSPAGQPRCDIVDEPQEVLPSGSCEVLLNAGGRGYYFSEYTPDGLRALAKDLSKLTPVERLRLVSDEWWMVQAGRHDVAAYLDLASRFASSDTPNLIETITTTLTFTADVLADDDSRPRFESWIRTGFGPSLESIGLPGTRRDSDDVQNRRAALMILVGVTGRDTAVRRRAGELVAAYIKDPPSLPPSIVPAVLQVAAVGGDRVLYDQYVGRLDGLAGKPEEYYRFLNALPWFTDPALVARTLDLALTPAIRSQDTGVLIAQVIDQPWGREAGWTFVTTHWDALTSKLGTFQGIPRVIGVLGGFCSTESAADVRRFFTEHPVPSSERAVQQAVERIETCAAVRARQAAPLAGWLAKAG